MTKPKTPKAVKFVKGKKPEKVERQQREEFMFSMPANHSSDELLVLDADAKAASLKALEDIFGALGFLHEQIKKNTCQISTRFNCISLGNRHLERLGKLLGSDEDKKQEQERDVSMIRAANLEAERLRRELGKAVSVEAIGHKLQDLSQVVYHWWKGLGFMYSKGSFEGHFRGGDYHVELSCYIDPTERSIMEDKPVTAKEVKAQLIKELGEQIDLDTETDTMIHVIDTPKSRDWIFGKLQERFPTVRISEIKSFPIHKMPGKFMIREIQAYIPIQDIEEEDEPRSDQK